MDDSFEFPLYVCLDDGTVIQIESHQRILYHLEAIDIENSEYQFWDTLARPLRVCLKNGKVTGLVRTANEITLPEAFKKYAEQLGVNIDVDDKPERIWANLKSAEESRRRGAGILSRLLGARKI